MKPQLQFQRYELKYYLSEQLCSALINMIRPYMTLDPHLEQRKASSYLVRSVYLDTDNFRFYHDKMSGICHREKLRVRAYNKEHSEIFLEIKGKHNNYVVKDRACVYYDDLPYILDRYGGYRLNDGVSKVENDFIMRFLSYILVMQLRPVILIAYDRQAYTGIFDQNIRLTLDCNLRCLPGRSYDLFYSGGNWISVNKPCILELKFNNVMPFFFKSIIRRFNLRAQGVSKYCLCIERSKPILL